MTNPYEEYTTPRKKLEFEKRPYSVFLGSASESPELLEIELGTDEEFKAWKRGVPGMPFSLKSKITKAQSIIRERLSAVLSNPDKKLDILRNDLNGLAVQLAKLFPAIATDGILTEEEANSLDKTITRKSITSSKPFVSAMKILQDTYLHEFIRKPGRLIT